MLLVRLRSHCHPSFEHPQSANQVRRGGWQDQLERGIRNPNKLRKAPQRARWLKTRKKILLQDQVWEPSHCASRSSHGINLSQIVLASTQIAQRRPKQFACLEEVTRRYCEEPKVQPSTVNKKRTGASHILCRMLFSFLSVKKILNITIVRIRTSMYESYTNATLLSFFCFG